MRQREGCTQISAKAAKMLCSGIGPQLPDCRLRGHITGVPTCCSYSDAGGAKTGCQGDGRDRIPNALSRRSANANANAQSLRSYREFLCGVARRSAWFCFGPFWQQAQAPSLARAVRVCLGLGGGTACKSSDSSELSIENTCDDMCSRCVS